LRIVRRGGKSAIRNLFFVLRFGMLTEEDLAVLQAAEGGVFAFQPPVRGFAENRWRLERATRIELGAINLGTGDQVWFPRTGVSRVVAEQGAVKVVLSREYEYRGGLWPVRSAAGS
jgi:hypothetical protein